MTQPFNVLAIINLKAKLRPTDRGDLEDAFLDFCQQKGIDADVVGGGTLIEENGEMIESDIEVELTNDNADTIQQIIDFFEYNLAPKGSSITINALLENGDYDESKQEKKILFGEQQGLAIYLNGVDLPTEVYQQSDINVVWEELDKAIDGIGKIHSYWQGNTETALYMYGKSFDEMKHRIEPFINSYPLCQQSRIVQTA